MNNRDKSLFDAIRNGTEEEAKEIFDELMKNNIKGAAGSIIARNFSHGSGIHAHELVKFSREEKP